MHGKLAIDGGDPVRTREFPPRLIGTSMIGPEELAEVTDVIQAKCPFRHYGIGKPSKAKLLEQEMGAFLGVRYALAVSSGTAALFSSLVALGVGVGDEVILPSFGWYSDYAAILHVGATPIFAGVDETLNLEPAEFERRITPRTKAVIVIHYQGGPARMDEILAIARRRNVRVVEDVAQALGGTYRGRMLGTLGDIGITSFQNNKMITAGEGGLIYTSHEAYFVRAVRHHDLGMVRPVFREQLADPSLADEKLAFPGLQHRITELQAGFLRAQLRKLPGILRTCRGYHRQIRQALADCRSFVFRPVEEGDCGITLLMRFPSAQQASVFADALRAEGIPVGPTSACMNLLEKEMIQSRRMAGAGGPPFGEGYAGAAANIFEEPVRRRTTAIVSSYTAVGIGPRYTPQDVDDIITAVRKVDRHLSPRPAIEPKRAAVGAAV